jgi:hypothetical protein
MYKKLKDLSLISPALKSQLFAWEENGEPVIVVRCPDEKVKYIDK